MAEQLTLTTPVTPPAPTTSDYRIRSLYFNWDEPRIAIILRDNNGVVLACEYLGAAATSLMIALNKANLSTQSLHKRVLQQLASDGKLAAGSVTGSPD